VSPFRTANRGAAHPQGRNTVEHAKRCAGPQRCHRAHRQAHFVLRGNLPALSPSPTVA
jgi:hypothetical protein